MSENTHTLLEIRSTINYFISRIFSRENPLTNSLHHNPVIFLTTIYNISVFYKIGPSSRIQKIINNSIDSINNLK